MKRNPYSYGLNMKLIGSMKVKSDGPGNKFFVHTSGLGARLLIAGFDGDGEQHVEETLLACAKKNWVYDVDITIKRRKR